METTETTYVDTETEARLGEFQLLINIVYNSQLPKAFCLKEYMNWDDAKIKKFLKEYKKINKKSTDTKCCGTE